MQVMQPNLYNMAGNVNEWVYDVYRPMSFKDFDDLNPDAIKGALFKGLLGGLKNFNSGYPRATRKSGPAKTGFVNLLYTKLGRP